MKRRSLLFFIYSVVVILVVILSLVFIPQIKKLINSNNKPKEDDSSTVIPPIDDTIYATSLTINISALEVFVDTKVVLNDNYISVVPVSLKNTIEYSIKTLSGNPTTLIILDNNVLQAKAVGVYKITFSVKSSKTTTISKSLNVTVTNNIASAKIKKKVDSLTIGDTVDFADLFNTSIANVGVYTDSLLSYTEGKFTALAIGESKLTVTLIDNYVTYVYDFVITIKDLPEYKIVVPSAVNNTITIQFDTNPIKQIYFETLNRDDEYVDQIVIAEIKDTNILEKVNVASPYVTVKAKSKGTSNVVLKLKSNNEIQLILTIIVQ